VSTAPDHLRAAASEFTTRAEPSAPRAISRELSPTDAVLFRVRALLRRRLAWLDHLHAGASDDVPTDPFAALEENDNPEAERRWAEKQSALSTISNMNRAIEKALAADVESPLGRVVSTFRLPEAECDVLHVCLALELDPSLSQGFTRADAVPGRGHVTMSLVSRLCGWPREQRVGPASSLLRWQLVRTLEAAVGDAQSLRLDAHILDFVCGRFTLDPELAGVAAHVESREPLTNWPVSVVAERVARGLEKGAALRLVVKGPRGSGRRTFCAAVAESLGSGLLGIDTSSVSDGDWPATFLRAQRQALLFGQLLVWHGDGVGRRWPGAAMVAPLQFVTGEADVTPGSAPDFLDEAIAMPRPSIDERAALFRAFVPVSQAWSASDLARLAERFQVEIGDIVSIGRRGASTQEEVRELCRAATRDRLGDLGKMLDCPFSREDLVLAGPLDERLDEFLFEAKDRARFWESQAARRLFPRGTGLVALMTGPPGTGKTMAAQIIATELGLDLFRIDLATSMSKYIGETAKHLRRIFQRAADMNAVLLFDEADALFTKRTDVRDAHDRYANTDTNYLLQLIEDFGGVALLSSNKKQNMDTAFVRRIRYLFDFPRPGATERLRLWQRIVKELAGPASATELDALLGTLAEVIDVSGAQIKLAVLGALFLARQEGKPLGLEHLVRGAARELAKEGRGITPAERERISAHG